MVKETITHLVVALVVQVALAAEAAEVIVQLVAVALVLHNKVTMVALVAVKHLITKAAEAAEAGVLMEQVETVDLVVVPLVMRLELHPREAAPLDREQVVAEAAVMVAAAVVVKPQQVKQLAAVKVVQIHKVEMVALVNNG